MSSRRNDQRALALKQLVERFEAELKRQETPFLSQEQFEDLLSHYFDQGDFDQTLYVADLAISQHTYTPEFYKWKALIHKINLEETEALETMDKLATYAPNDEESMMLRLEIYVHFEKIEEAKDLLDILYSRVEGDKKRSILFFFQGLVLLTEEDVEGSWAALLESIDLDAYQEPALDEVLNASEFDGLRKNLPRFFRRTLDRDPFNHLVWYYLGLWYEDYGRDLQALDAFGNARSLYEKETRYELSYADKLFDLERFEAALGAYRTYFAMPSSEGGYETFMRLGRSYQMLDDAGRAKAAYFKAIEADPGMYDTYQYLGECFAAEGKWGVAAHNYGRAVELPGHSAECWLGLALCLSALNQMDDAEDAYRKAITFEERYSEATVSYAIFLADTGREHEAATLMTKTLETYEDASLLYGMVAVCLISNKRPRALEYLNEALAGYYDDRNRLLDWYPDLLDDKEVSAIFKLHES